MQEATEWIHRTITKVTTSILLPTTHIYIVHYIILYYIVNSAVDSNSLSLYAPCVHEPDADASRCCSS